MYQYDFISMIAYPCETRGRNWRPTRHDASVEPSEHHKQSDKDDGADQDPGGSRVHASLLFNASATARDQ
jgi:hypothetical protein